MRSDDDSWDITESVGATAVGVAAMRAAETRRPDALFHDPYAERLVEAVGSGWSRILRGEIAVPGVGNENPNADDSDGDDARAAAAVHALRAMVIARTIYFDDYFAAVTAAGIRQIVILASGLDARAFRIEFPSGTAVFEIDQPKVLSFKDSVLTDAEPAADRHAIAVDLRQDWPKALRDKGFDPAVPTAWLAEGLLRYLPAEAQDQLFDDVVALSAPGSRFALNIGRGRPEDSPALRALRERRARSMAEAGIDLQLEKLLYPWEGRTDPRDWFAARGWIVARADPAAILTERGRALTEAARTELNRHLLITATLGDENR